MELQTFIADLEGRGLLSRLANAPRLQFGNPNRQFLGAQFLPERRVLENSFRDTEIRYKTKVANDGTRFSPVQIKRGGRLVGSMLVELGHQDIGDEFTGVEYDAWVALLRAVRPGNTPTPEQVLQVLNWAETSLAAPLAVKNEVQRWQAIVDAQVALVGNNGYVGMVNFPNPSGHRAAALGDWSDNAYDPMDDILAMAQLLYGKGYAVNAIVTSSRVVTLLSRNGKIAQRAKGSVLVVSGGALETISGTVTLADINNMLVAEGLPQITVYDLRYDTTTGSERFLPNDVFVMLATTGQTVDIDLGGDDGQRILDNVLGYLAIGRATGQSAPGRVIVLTPFKNKPPRVEGEAWQTSFPVISDPEAIAVISDIQ